MIALTAVKYNNVIGLECLFFISAGLLLFVAV